MRFPPNNLGSKVVIQKIRSRRHYSENKSKARKELIKERKLFFAQSIEASNNIAGNLIKYFIYNNYSIINKKISIYWPIGSEVNTKPCIAALYDFGAKICLASTEDNDVKYRLWKPNDKIEINKLGIKINSKEVKNPDIIICPLLGFDNKLNRLGRGGGYYDKSLYKYKNTMKIGLAYSVQKINILPKEKHDVSMDAIITEKNIYN
tara:strand:+ start:618 stop:1235 length:618 start_codon:yes stop_codon:yes gene_type:complete